MHIERVLSPTSEISALIIELDDELSKSYLPEQRHGLALHAIFQSNIRFFIARTGGLPVGCGGVALFPEFAELKRMYVRPTARGQGVADAILFRLEEETLDNSLMILRLETGMHSNAAIRFYRRHGFESCVAYEPYSAMPPQAIASSLFFEKRLPRDHSPVVSVP